jgi:hypothetical protein
MTAVVGRVSRWRVRTGYPVGLAFLLLAHPARPWVVAGAAVAALGLLLRGAAAGYLHKHEQLATSGPYGLTLNPLYLGSAILAVGFVVAGASWFAAALVAGYFLAFYPAVMRREEQELRTRYGAAFEEYARRVPLFWPRLSSSSTPDSSGFSWAQYRRNREYQAAIGTLAGFAILACKPLWTSLFPGL